MDEKTPVSALQEFCIKEGESVPMYDLIHEESDGKNFTYVVNAFDMLAKGSGRSKREAKHEASAKLMSMLNPSTLHLKKQLIVIHLNFVGYLKERGKLVDVPQTPRPTSETDAVGTLLDICVQRNLPLAR